MYTEAGSSPLLSIGRAKHRFLDEEGGRVTQITLDCLKPYVGTGDTLEEYEGHRDVHTFPIQDVFGGPLTMLLVSRTKKWKVENLKNVQTYFDTIKDCDRAKWHQEFVGNM